MGLNIGCVDGEDLKVVFDGDGLTDVLQQNFPGPDDLFAIGLIGQELTVESFYFFFTQHAIQAVEQQHLHLCIDEDIFKAAGIAMVQ